MLNPVTATSKRTAHGAHTASSPSHREASTSSRFAPLFTRAVGLAIGAVDDELGRPLIAAYVPDDDLL
jgi:hypothetical protein